MGTRLTTHIAQILEIPDKVPLSVNDLVDGFLTLLLGVAAAVEDLSWDSLTPERARFLACQHRVRSHETRLD